MSFASTFKKKVFWKSFKTLFFLGPARTGHFQWLPDFLSGNLIEKYHRNQCWKSRNISAGAGAKSQIWCGCGRAYIYFGSQKIGDGDLRPPMTWGRDFEAPQIGFYFWNPYCSFGLAAAYFLIVTLWLRWKFEKWPNKCRAFLIEDIIYWTKKKFNDQISKVSCGEKFRSRAKKVIL